MVRTWKSLTTDTKFMIASLQFMYVHVKYRFGDSLHVPLFLVVVLSQDIQPMSILRQHAACHLVVGRGYLRRSSWRERVGGWDSKMHWQTVARLVGTRHHLSNFTRIFLSFVGILKVKIPEAACTFYICLYLFISFYICSIAFLNDAWIIAFKKLLFCQKLARENHQQDSDQQDSAGILCRFFPRLILEEVKFEKGDDQKKVDTMVKRVIQMFCEEIPPVSCKTDGYGWMYFVLRMDDTFVNVVRCLSGYLRLSLRSHKRISMSQKQDYTDLKFDHGSFLENQHEEMGFLPCSALLYSWHCRIRPRLTFLTRLRRVSRNGQFGCGTRLQGFVALLLGWLASMWKTKSFPVGLGADFCGLLKVSVMSCFFSLYRNQCTKQWEHGSPELQFLVKHGRSCATFGYIGANRLSETCSLFPAGLTWRESWLDLIGAIRWRRRSWILNRDGQVKKT